jgi:putative hydrolases of HD superfamily
MAIFKNKDMSRLAQLLYEVGTMRKLARMHRQPLLTDDLSDNISTHSYRVAIIGFLLAKLEKADPGKVMLMCLIHDLGESRTSDHNWIHKRYIIEDQMKVMKEQLGSLPIPDFMEIAEEYEIRKSKESLLAKDADMLDQILLLREYVWQGNKEAQLWLDGKRVKKPYNYIKFLHSKSAKALGRAIYDEEPSSWWKDLYTKHNRKR